MIPRLIPILLLDGERLVKTKSFQHPKYVGDPINTVKIFNEKQVDELFLIDITASEKNAGPNFKLIEEIVSEAFMPIAVGGGISSAQDALDLVALGVEKVVFQSALFNNQEAVKSTVGLLGAQAVVGALDFRRSGDGEYLAWTDRGVRPTALTAEDTVKFAQSLGVGELLCTDIDREGRRTGLSQEFVTQVAKVSATPIVVNGGSQEISDFGLALKSGADALGAGAMLVFSGRHDAVLISYPNQHVLRSFAP